MGLFRPAWQHHDEQRAVNAVQQISDTDHLLEIIFAEKNDLARWADKTASSKAVRIAAVNKISDESILKQITVSKSALFVRKAALQLISDKDFLCEFIKGKDYDEPLRLHAIQMLAGEEDLLLDTALHARYTSVRNQAAQMLVRHENIIQILESIRIYSTDLATRTFVRDLFLKIDEVARCEICIRTKDSTLCSIGETTLTDKSLLLKLARQTGYFSPKNAGILKSLTQDELHFCCIRCFDIEKTLLILDVLWDSSLLLKVADDEKWRLREDGDRVIRKAIDRITNLNFIERTAAERHAGFEINETSLVLELLLEKVENQQILAQIAKNTNVFSLVRIIAKKLTDIELLCDVAKNGQSANLFESMIPRISHPMLLAFIACRKVRLVRFSIDAYGMSSDPEELIRKAARERLMDLTDNEKALAYITENTK